MSSDIQRDESQMKFMKLLQTQGELHPDLVPCLETVDGLGQCLRHPMLFHLFYMPQLNAMLNRQYAAKKKYIAESLVQKKWSSVLVMYERPHRMEIFAQYQSQMTNREYWENLAWVWTDSENLWQYGALPGALLCSQRPDRDYLMKPEERSFLNSLPEMVTIYRGHGKKNRRGWSWTLSVQKARWFARRFAKSGWGVSRMLVPRSAILAYFSGRGEYEVVIDRRDRKWQCFESVMPVPRPRWMNELYIRACEEFSLGSHSDHGPDHWNNVERNAVALAEETPGADPLVTQLFALIHDCQRQNESSDPEHGRRAAQWIREQWLPEWPLSAVQITQLAFACEFHDQGEVSDDPTVGVCWDADRLDLPRVGITPDRSLLSTEAARTKLWQI